MTRVFLLSTLLLAGCAKNPAYHNNEFMMMTERQEYELGKKSREATSNSKIYKSESKQKYFNDLAQKVYGVTERSENDLVVYFLNDDTMNAAASPGFMYINRGLMPFMQDEATLMAAMAHESGHITARHSARDYSNRFLINWFINSVKPKISKQAKGNMVDAFNMSYSRTYENEADELSVRYLKKLNVPAENSMLTYKAFALKEEIEYKLANLNEYKKIKIKPVSEYKRTHPLPDERVKNIAEKSNKWYEFIEPYRQKEFYKQIDGLEYGYKGKSTKDNIIDLEDIVSGKSGIYGYKNIAYFKKDKLKMLMPDNYQARIMAADPIGFNYNRQIKVSVNHISEDKNLYAVDIVGKVLKLKPNQLDDLKDSIRKNKDKFFDSLDSDEQLISYTQSASVWDMLWGEKTNYHYIYVKQLDDSANVDYFNHFRIIILSSNIKKSFDETMQNDILFIKDNLVELTKKQANTIKPLTIKIKQAKKTENIEKLSKINIPYIHFEQEWFRLFNGLYNELNTETAKGQWLKLIPNPNKDI